LTVNQIVALARADPDEAYARWKGADTRSAAILQRKHPEVADMLQRAEQAKRSADAERMRKDKAVAEAARAGEAKRRREQFDRNPLRRLAPYMMAAFAWLLMQGHGKP
jgi:hypothetical protein